MNAKMPELVRAFEAAGFQEVKTILGSGNVNFGSRKAARAKLEQRAEAAMENTLHKSFMTLVRELSELEQMLERDPFMRFSLPAKAKRVVTFLRAPAPAGLTLPVRLGQARILAVEGDAAFSAYVPDPKDGPLFMKLIERTFGKELSTRTWDTVAKIVKAG